MIGECPIKVCGAFGLTLAAIIRLANVCRHSCSVIGRSRASRQVSFARLLIVEVANSVPSARPNTRPVDEAAGLAAGESQVSCSRRQPALRSCSRGYSRRHRRHGCSCPETTARPSSAGRPGRKTALPRLAPVTSLEAKAGSSRLAPYPQMRGAEPPQSSPSQTAWRPPRALTRAAATGPADPRPRAPPTPAASRSTPPRADTATRAATLDTRPLAPAMLNR